MTLVAAHVTGGRRMRGAAGAVQAGGAEGGGGGGGRSGAGVKWRTGSPASTRTGISRYFLRAAPPRAITAPYAGLHRLPRPPHQHTGALCAGPTLRRGGERHRGQREGPRPALKMTRGRRERPGHGGQRAACCDGGGEGPTPRRDPAGESVRGSTLHQ